MRKLPKFASLGISLVLYLTLGFWLLPYFQYQINSDGTALLSVAYAIKTGDLQNSINAYWGLLSPLSIVPFLYIPNVQPVLLIKLSSLATGMAGLASFYFLAKRFPLTSAVRVLLMFLAIPVFLYFAFSVISSDLLIITLLMGYLALVFSPTFPKKLRYWLWAGVLGALLVMTKEYFLYFLILHLTLMAILQHTFTKPKRLTLNIFKPYLIGILVLIIISVGWGLVLNYRYHHFMFGARSAFNFGYFSPKAPQYQMFTEGLLKPPNPYGVSIWDEPYLLILPGWSPFQSPEYFWFEVNTTLKNSRLLLEVYQSYSVLFLLTFTVAVVYLIKTWKKSWPENKVLLASLLTILFYPVGYVVLSIEPRYFWINYMLLLLIGGVLLSRLIQKNKSLGLIVLTAFALTFLKTPVSYLKNYRFVDHTFYDQSKILKNYGVENKKVAANSNWHQTLFISVYNKNQFLGLPKRTSSFEEKVRELEKTSIDYYFSWDDNPDIDKFKEKFTEIKIEGISNLRVLNIQKPVSP